MSNVCLTFLVQSSTSGFSNILGLEEDREVAFVSIGLLKAPRNSGNIEDVILQHFLKMPELLFFSEQLLL